MLREDFFQLLGGLAAWEMGFESGQQACVKLVQARTGRLGQNVFQDLDFRLTESSAILKYLADKIGSPAYPSDPKRRARIDEMMDWLNTQFYRDWAYNLCYPQLFPHHKRRSDEAHAGAVEWGQQRGRRG